ncbi:MAG: hypothetical protein ACREF7_02140, partial [Candidatus Saccharimonadales bacterium]
NGETTQTATGLSAGSYTCTITDANGCKDFILTQIQGYKPSIIGISPYTDSSCGPNSQQLHVYGLTNNNYNWAPNTGLSCNNCPSPTASPTVTTTYTISGVDTNGCSVTAALTITVLNSNLTVTGNDSMCSGFLDTLTAKGGSTYVWSSGGTYDTIMVSPNSTITYTVTSSVGICPSQSVNFTVNIKPHPIPGIIATPDSICSGDSTLITGSGGSSYAWSNPPGGINPTVKVPPGTYSLAVTRD